MHLIRPTRRSGRALALPLALALSLGLLSGTSGSADAAATHHGFRENLAGPRDFVPQANFVQCVGASLQMMLNIVEPGTDHSPRTQRELQGLARAWSGPTPSGFERQGASVRGWVASLVIHRAGAYRAVGADSLRQAMRIAATAIRRYHRPVGLLVWRGRHAWVMSGYVATADPVGGKPFTVTAAYILDPLYPYGSSTWGPSPKPGTAVSIAAVGRQFVRRRSSGPWSHLPGADWLRNKYVLVVPTGAIQAGID